MVFQGESDRLPLAVHIKLAQDGLEVIAYRGIADTECLGNVTGGFALHQEIQDFLFPSGQGGFLKRRSTSAAGEEALRVG